MTHALITLVLSVIGYGFFVWLLWKVFYLMHQEQRSVDYNYHNDRLN